tara:strand:- start:752 stop:997 length:246 start_codon:yes stop_codon:yes gene_type:complete
LRGLGIVHTVTLPFVLHLGFLVLGLPSGEKFLGLLGMPSGETPNASTEGKIDPNIRSTNNSFFIGLNLDTMTDEVLYHPSL